MEEIKFSEYPTKFKKVSSYGIYINKILENSPTGFFYDREDKNKLYIRRDCTFLIIRDGKTREYKLDKSGTEDGDEILKALIEEDKRVYSQK